MFQGTQSRRTDIEALCEIIYGYGERYPDGTAAIGFTWLFKVLHNLFEFKRNLSKNYYRCSIGQTLLEF